MTDAATQAIQAKAARLAGAMFLLVNATGIFSEIFVRGSLLTSDVTQTAQNIIASERFFRLGILGDLITFTGVAVLVWALYLLLRPVNRELTLLAALLRVIEVAVGVTLTVSSLIAVRILSGADYLQAFEPDQLHALSRLARNAFGLGQSVGFIFVGLGSTLFAYLLFQSRYVPRILAGWGLFASLLFTAYNLALVVFPEFVRTLMYVAFAPMGIYEIGLGFWLLIRGATLPTSAAEAR